MIAPHMRHSLSVKDDDYRLSFLYGNFVTLTNMGRRITRRCAAAPLSSLCIGAVHKSVLRAEMLRCSWAGIFSDSLRGSEAAGVGIIRRWCSVQGLNDGEEAGADDSRRPRRSVSCSLTRHRARWADKTSRADPRSRSQFRFDRDGAARVIGEFSK